MCLEKGRDLKYDLLKIWKPVTEFSFNRVLVRENAGTGRLLNYSTQLIWKELLTV